MANESYDEFASSLQEEYQEDGIRFRVLEVANFANIPAIRDEAQNVDGNELERRSRHGVVLLSCFSQ